MAMKWFLTRQAEESLLDIANWTFDQFGPRQAEIYRDELITVCEKIAGGHAISQSCSVLADTLPNEELRFTRAGQHYIVFLETQKPEVVIIDFLHSRADLEKRLAKLSL
jgi:plasmid stabilization system protein ParE